MARQRDEAPSKKRHQPTLRVVGITGELLVPRRYAQSTSGRSTSQRTRPKLSRSKAMTSDSPNKPPAESFFLMYPRLVPQRLAKDSCPAKSSEFKYERSSAMSGDVSISECLPLGKLMSIPGEHLPRGNSDQNVSMDVYEIRRRKLVELIAEVGGQVELARLLDQVRPEKSKISPSYISRMKSTGEGRKRISTDMAYDLEKATNKPHGWMSDISVPTSSPITAKTQGNRDWPLSVPLSVFESLSPRAQREIDEAFTKLVMGAQAQELLTKTRKQV